MFAAPSSAGNGASVTDAGGWETSPFERPLGRGVVIQVFVANVDAVATRIERAGLPYFIAPFEKWRDWGDCLGGQLEFLVLDPSGHLVKVAQQLGERLKPVENKP